MQYQINFTKKQQEWSLSMTEDQLARFCLNASGGGLDFESTANAMDMQTRLLRGDEVTNRGTTLKLVPNENSS